MVEKKDNPGSRVERMDLFWTSRATRRRERIRKTMLRPLYQEVLKNLFLALVLIVDVLLPLQVFMSLGFPVNMLAALVAVCVLLYIEMRIWNAVWGRSGRWSLEKYDKGQRK